MNENTEEKLDGLTKQEWFEKIQDWDVSLVSYYKYSFEYCNSGEDTIKTGYEINIKIGGCSDDIYRCEIFAHELVPVKLLELDPNYISIKNIATGESMDWYTND